MLKIKVKTHLWSGFSDYKEDIIKYYPLIPNKEFIIDELFGKKYFFITEINNDYIKIKIHGGIILKSGQKWEETRDQNEEYVINKISEMKFFTPVTDCGPLYSFILDEWQ